MKTFDETTKEVSQLGDDQSKRDFLKEDEDYEHAKQKKSLSEPELEISTVNANEDEIKFNAKASELIKIIEER